MLQVIVVSHVTEVFRHRKWDRMFQAEPQIALILSLA